MGESRWLRRPRGGGEAAPPLAGAAYPGGMDSSFWVAVFWSLVPTLVVSVLFFWVLRSIIRSDRTERRIYARIQAEERAKRGLPPLPAAGKAAPADR